MYLIRVSLFRYDVTRVKVYIINMCRTSPICFDSLCCLLHPKRAIYYFQTLYWCVQSTERDEYRESTSSTRTWMGRRFASFVAHRKQTAGLIGKKTRSFPFTSFYVEVPAFSSSSSRLLLAFYCLVEGASLARLWQYKKPYLALHSLEIRCNFVHKFSVSNQEKGGRGATREHSWFLHGGRVLVALSFCYTRSCSLTWRLCVGAVPQSMHHHPNKQLCEKRLRGFSIAKRLGSSAAIAV